MANQIILVTARNHEWAASVTGKTVEEIHAEYQNAQDNEKICILTADPILVGKTLRRVQL